MTFVIFGLFFWWTVTALYLYENGEIIYNYQGPFVDVEFSNWQIVGFLFHCFGFV